MPCTMVKCQCVGGRRRCWCCWQGGCVAMTCRTVSSRPTLANGTPMERFTVHLLGFRTSCWRWHYLPTFRCAVGHVATCSTGAATAIPTLSSSGVAPWSTTASSTAVSTLKASTASSHTVCLLLLKTKWTISCPMPRLSTDVALVLAFVTRFHLLLERVGTGCRLGVGDLRSRIPLLVT